MIKRILAMVLCTLLLFPLTGCWDYVEYNDLAQIVAIGIDYDKQTENVILTLQSIPTSRSGKSSGNEEQSNNKGLVHSASDTTLFGALSKLQEIVDKNFFFGYSKILLIGEDAAENILLPMIDLHDRTPFIRSSSYIAFTKGKAENVLSTIDSSHSEIAGNTLGNLLETVSITGTSLPITIQQFMEMLSISGLEAIGPCTNTTVENVDVKGGIMDNIKANERKEGKLSVSGLAAFKGGSLAGWLDEKESIGFAWITGKKIKAYKFSESMSGGKIDEAYFRIGNTKSKLKVNIVNNTPSVDLNVKVACSLRKYYTDQTPEFLDNKQLSQLEKELSKSIRSDIEAALKKGQKELQTDIFGFGFEFYRKHVKLWNEEYEKEWNDLFPQIPVNISVNVSITNTGTNIRSLIVK